MGKKKEEIYYDYEKYFKDLPDVDENILDEFFTNITSKYRKDINIYKICKELMEES